MKILLFKTEVIFANVLFHCLCVVGFRLAQTEDCGKVDESSPDLRTKVPWTAGIFARTSSNSPFEYYITGTIIGPTTILTALGGAYGKPPRKDRKYTIPSAANHLVAVGLTSTDINIQDPHTQISEVSYILPYNGYDAENSQYHFFIFHIKEPLNFSTSYVKPACVPVFLKSLPTTLVDKKSEVRQGGFALSDDPNRSSAKQLRVIVTELESESTCQKEYEAFYDVKGVNHIYCGRSMEKKVPPVCVSYGSAPMVPVYNNRWFIVGILTLHPIAENESSWCNSNTIYFYGKILSAVDWIMDNLQCPPTKFSCGENVCIPLDSVCDQIKDCSDGRDEDAIYCRARKPCITPGRKFECGTYGPCLKDSLVCNEHIDCPDAEDESPELCGKSLPAVPLTASQRPMTFGSIAGEEKIPQSTLPSWIALSNRDRLHCPPIQKSDGVIIECYDSNKMTIPCSQAVPGSVARFKCQEHYVSTYRLPTTEMTCKQDGTWKPFRAFGCEAQCGILDNKLVQSLVVSGQATTPHEAFPWHAAIFASKHGEFSFICGGSLVEKSAIITAAHCVTDGSGSLLSKTNFRVVLGGNSSTFENNGNKDRAQSFEVKNIWVPATYDRRTLQSDIAIIELDKEAKYGKFVRPVCYLIKGSNSVPPPGTLGKVPGYGYTNEHKISESLIFAQFPVISGTDCIASLKKTPPLSTFCAGYKNGTSVCQGDSGGGMVFPEQSDSVEKYVLKGLVSHGEVKIGRLCDPNNYAVFTHVDAYADWIIQKLHSIIRR